MVLDVQLHRVSVLQFLSLSEKVLKAAWLEQGHLTAGNVPLIHGISHVRMDIDLPSVRKESCSNVTGTEPRESLFRAWFPLTGGTG